MKNKTKRYKKVCKGIRKDNFSGHFSTYKKFRGKSYSETFDILADAKEWRRNFKPIEEKIAQKDLTFGELVSLYIEKHLSNQATSTRAVKSDRLKFFSDIAEKHVNDLDSPFIYQYFLKKLAQAKEKNSRRASFKEEIKDLRAILNWYQEAFNPNFMVPISRNLYRNTILKKEVKMRPKMSEDEFCDFYNKLDPFFQQLALTQVLIAGRISEVTGMQIPSIDFKSNKVLIKHIVVYGRKKEFVELKESTKTNKNKVCEITPNLRNILEARLKEKHPESNYVFHIDGKPLKYRHIQHAYNKALERAGLDHKFSGTHFLRHFTASVTGKVCGSIRSVQAVTNHDTEKQAQLYSGNPIDLQAEAILTVEKHLNVFFQKKLRKSCANEVIDMRTKDVIN